MKITIEFRRAVIEKAKSLKESLKPVFGSKWWKQAMIEAWDFIKKQVSKATELNKKLRKEAVVTFSYKNAKGEIRHAKGTKRADIMNAQLSHKKSNKKTSNRKKNPLNVRYWDLERMAFRSFNILRLI